MFSIDYSGLKYSNQWPTLHFSGPFSKDEFLYEEFSKDDKYTLWLARNPIDRVNFYVEDSENHMGFGGASILIKLKNGGTRILHGPWAGREGLFNKIDNISIIECVNRSCAEYLHLSWVLEQLKKNKQDIRFYLVSIEYKPSYPGDLEVEPEYYYLPFEPHMREALEAHIKLRTNENCTIEILEEISNE